MSATSLSTVPIIEVKDLFFAYKKHMALKGLTFSVEVGSIHGFVGPNGAGKTTTLKILATLLKPDRGTVHVFGKDVVRNYKQVRKHIGFMPDYPGLYKQMTVFEYLDFFAAAYGLRVAERNQVIDDCLRLTDMEGRKDAFIKSLSRGMQQRLSLARILVNDPELLLLDEPASGLDPRARIELMEILKELSRLGKTIFISSHILSELGSLCDSVTIIDRGHTRYCGAMSGLTAGRGRSTTYLLTVAQEQPSLEQALGKLDGITDVTKVAGRPSYRVTFDRQQLGTGDILRTALATGAEVRAFQEDTKQLSQAFMDLTEPGVPT